MTRIIARMKLLKFPCKIAAFLCLGTLPIMILIGILVEDLYGAILGWSVLVLTPSVIGLGLTRIFFADDWHYSD